MNRKELFEGFIKIISPYVSDKEALAGATEGSHLLTDLKINSSNVVDIVLDAETQYNIVFQDDDFEKLSTVGSCLNIVEEKLAANAGGE